MAMKKKFRDTEAWKWIRTAIEILLIVGVVWLAVHIYTSAGNAEADGLYWEAYVICMPNDEVNIRVKPSRGSESLGRYECGEMILLDGKRRNGYLHCVNLALEMDSGWIHSGYVVYDKPERVDCTACIVSKGRLAARKNVGGRRTRWLKPLASLKVYYWSDDWCVTNCGYVQSKYLEMEGDEN